MRNRSDRRSWAVGGEAHAPTFVICQPGWPEQLAWLSGRRTDPTVCPRDGHMATPDAAEPADRPVPRRAEVLVPSRRAVDRKTSPDMTPRGERSHSRTASARSGNAVRNNVSRLATRRRAVDVSATTRRRPTTRASQPRPLPIRGASRSFRSSVEIVACASGITDLTSITSRARADSIPAEDVDGATLAEVAEGDFDRRLPAAPVEGAEHLVDKGCVGSIEQAIQRLAMPSNAEVDVGAESRSCRDKRLDRDASKLPALDAPVLRPGHPGPRRDVGLAQAAMQAQRSERSTDPERLHVPSMAVGDYRAISAAPSATLHGDGPARRTDRARVRRGDATLDRVGRSPRSWRAEGARIGIVYRRPETAPSGCAALSMRSVPSWRCPATSAMTMRSPRSSSARGRRSGRDRHPRPRPRERAARAPSRAASCDTRAPTSRPRST